MALAVRPSPSKFLPALVMILMWLASSLAIEATANAKDQQRRRATASKASRLTPLPKVLDRQGLAALLTRHRGQVVLVNFWATWCEPCREEFPRLKDLEERYRSRGLVVLAVSVDIPSAYPQVKKFLRDQKPGLATYLKKPGEDEEFINATDPSWTGALPATFVYDITGKRVRSLFGEQDANALDAAVRDLVPHADAARPSP